MCHHSAVLMLLHSKEMRLGCHSCGSGGRYGRHATCAVSIIECQFVWLMMAAQRIAKYCVSSCVKYSKFLVQFFVSVLRNSMLQSKFIINTHQIKSANVEANSFQLRLSVYALHSAIMQIVLVFYVKCCCVFPCFG